ncbi:MAG TPA: hypothetical protein VKZ18_21925 [Polyangia bacterium]|nr:hypothetical protein [Polyangia bacterium]
MSFPHDDGSELCGRVFDRLVEGADVGADPVLSEHLGSCVTCFRSMTELRDAPRVAEAVRAEAPSLPRANDPFWETLAVRTTAAAEAALRGGTAVPAEAPASRSVKPAASRALVARGVARVRIVSVAATLAAAAAAFMLSARRPLPPPPGELPSNSSAHVERPQRSIETALRTGADEVLDTEADVADLDAGALRRLLERMRPNAPVALTSSAGGTGDAADLLGEDEGRMNDELADLDGAELRRVAGSLEAGAR